MKVALVCPYELRRPGGVRTHIAGLGTALVERGHEVEIIAPTDEVRLDSLPVIGCGAARRLAFGGTQIDLTWAPWPRVRKVAARGYDVMHFHTIWNPLVPFQIAAMFRGPKVATFHDVPGPDTPTLAKAVMPMASEMIRSVTLDRVIAVSGLVAAYLADGRYEIIPNGVTVPRLPPEGARKSVLYVGRLEPRKGVRTLLEAAELLGASGPEILIAGDGYLRRELEAFAASHGLDNVRFLGEVDEQTKWTLLRSAAVFVAPSVGGESFGIVLLEAMAAGTPPIAADNPGYRAVLSARANELLFPVNDANALAARIVQLTTDDAARDTLRAWGEQEWRQYDWSVLAERVECVYANALSSRA